MQAITDVLAFNLNVIIRLPQYNRGERVSRSLSFRCFWYWHF